MNSRQLRVVLEAIDQFLPLLLRHRAVQPHEVQLALGQHRLDQVEHGGPFGEEQGLAVRLGEQPVEQLAEVFQLARIARRLLLDQERAVGRHAAHQQGLLQPQQVHFGDVRLARDHRHDAHVGAVQFHLLVGGRNADDLAGPRRKLLEHRLARAAAEDRPQILAQLVEVLVAQHLARSRPPRDGDGRSGRPAAGGDRRRTGPPSTVRPAGSPAACR